MGGPMPTHFRWLWYLVGLAGFGLMVVGFLGILGSARDLGILIPVIAVFVIVIVGGILWFRRSLNAAVAAAPSRQRAADAEPAERSPAAADASPDAVASVTQKPPANSGRTSRRGP